MAKGKEGIQLLGIQCSPKAILLAINDGPSFKSPENNQMTETFLIQDYTGNDAGCHLTGKPMSTPILFSAEMRFDS